LADCNGIYTFYQNNANGHIFKHQTDDYYIANNSMSWFLTADLNLWTNLYYQCNGTPGVDGWIVGDGDYEPAPTVTLESGR